MSAVSPSLSSLLPHTGQCVGAVNTLSGSVYKDIPMSAFIQDHALNPQEAMRLGMPGAISSSPLYDQKKRESAKSSLNTPFAQKLNSITHLK